MAEIFGRNMSRVLEVNECQKSYGVVLDNYR
jgi:hypothetical protein